MKITIVNGEHLGSNWEIEIDKFDTIKTNRDETGKCLKCLNRKENNFLIYKNIILQNDKSMAFYKICPNDEIRWGKIENHLRCDDVILDIFLVSFERNGLLINLIVNADETISGIQSILNEILPGDIKIIDILNDQGESMENNQFIRQIDTSKGERRIICRLDDGDIDRSFDECCDIYDRYLVDQLWRDRYGLSFDADRYTNVDTHLIPIVREIVLFFVASAKKSRFDEDLASMARCLQHSRFLCCRSILDYIDDILFCGEEKYLLLLYEKYRHKYGPDGERASSMFQWYLHVAIRAAVVDYVTGLSYLHENHQQHHHKSVRDIIRDAGERVGTCLGGTDNIMQYFIISANKLLMKCRDEDWMRHRMLDDRHWIYLYVQRSVPKYIQLIIPPNIKTILQLKKAISLQTGTPLQQIFMIDNDRNVKPKDEDSLDVDKSDFFGRYSCQYVQSMDDIEILEIIGQGSFGKIFLCKHKISEELLALKKPTRGSNLDREIIIHAMIGGYSSNICRHRGLFNYRKRVCSAMDYKSGGTLGEFIKKRKCLPEDEFIKKRKCLPEDEFIKKRKYLLEHEIAKISHQILIQIKEMHDSGVIHRDIKPDNIVLDEDDHVYLIDFGISKLTSNYNVVPGDSMEFINQSPPGTVYYMAPELANCDKITVKIDTWSFGVMVIEMVNGQNPYHGLLENAVLCKISQIIKDKNIDFQLPESITEELRNFIKSCMELDPIKRATIDELIQSNFIKKYRDK